MSNSPTRRNSGSRKNGKGRKSNSSKGSSKGCKSNSSKGSKKKNSGEKKNSVKKTWYQKTFNVLKEIVPPLPDEMIAKICDAIYTYRFNNKKKLKQVVKEVIKVVKKKIV